MLLARNNNISIMNRVRFLQEKRVRRTHRVRARVTGTAFRPRLAVFRSVRFLSAQLIDDVSGRTLVAVHERELTDHTGAKTERAKRIGTLLGTRAMAAKIIEVVFDRRHYRYHGRVAAFADAARAVGLKF